MAGRGSRLRPHTLTIPKPLIPIAGKPIVHRLVEDIAGVLNQDIEEIAFIIHESFGKKVEEDLIAIAEKLGSKGAIYYQNEALGTGHAIMCCQSELVKNIDSNVLILSGDVPLLSTHTMTDLLNMGSDVKLITTTLKDPTGYGRIIEHDGVFSKIVEQKDCVIDQLHIARVNGGIYCITAQLLCRYLKQLNNNNSQSEYYLTDIIEIIKTNETMMVDMLEIPVEKVYEIMGVNTVDQLKELEQILKNKIEIENRLAVARINRNES